MKIHLLNLILYFTSFFFVSDLYSSELQFGFYPLEAEEKELSAHVIFELEKKADRSIRQDEDGNFGLGKMSGGVLDHIGFRFAEIENFLKNEKHKELVVVWFDPSVMVRENEFVRNRTAEVIDQMKNFGYERVVVLGVGNAPPKGIHYLADTNRDSE
jgi:hypothetical protein